MTARAPRDWRGTRIDVGDVVVYPSREGSRMWMTEGVVVSIEGDKVGVLKVDGKRPAYPALDRLTVLDEVADEVERV